MQVQRISNNNNYSTNFGAKVKISGWTDDITSKILKSWEKKAKEIGRDTDTVCLKFSEAKEHDFIFHEMGYPMECRHVKRSILGNVVLEDGTRTKKEYLGYRADRGEHSHEELTTSRVNDFLDKLREKIRK